MTNRQAIYLGLLIFVSVTFACNRMSAEPLPCETLKAQIDHTIQNNNVVNPYVLNIVPIGQAASGKVVGTCGGGAFKIVYVRTGSTGSEPIASNTRVGNRARNEVRVGDLPSGLIALLLKDLIPSENPTDADRAKVVAQTVTYDRVLGQDGRERLVIIHPSGIAWCGSAGCDAFVYIKSGDSYTSDLQDKNLSTARGYTNGFPNLRGSFQSGYADQYETLYTWNGHTYKATVCTHTTHYDDGERKKVTNCEDSSQDE